MSRQDQRRSQVALDGDDIGLFDKRTGGNIEADVPSYKDGDGENVLLPGSADPPANVVLERRYDKDRDHPNIGAWRRRVGRGAIVITELMLDADDNPVGRPDVYTGLLVGLEAPDFDSNSKDAGILKLTVKIKNVI